MSIDKLKADGYIREIAAPQLTPKDKGTTSTVSTTTTPEHVLSGSEGTTTSDTPKTETPVAKPETTQDAPKDNIGGTKGANVYNLDGDSESTGRKPVKGKEFHQKVNELFQDVDASTGNVAIPLVLGAQKVTKAGPKGPMHVLTVPINGVMVDVQLTIEQLSGPKYSDKAKGAVHEAGPAINKVEFDAATGTWKATISIDGRVGEADFGIVMAHELNEIAGVVHSQNANAVRMQSGQINQADLDKGITRQQSAKVFGAGAVSNGLPINAASLSAHDRAAMVEFEQMANQLGAFRAGNHHHDLASNSRAGVVENSVKEMINSLGLTSVSDPRYKFLLANTNISPDAVRWIENFLHAKANGNVLDPKVIDHLLNANPKNITPGDWAGWGVGGGHDTKSLRDLESIMVPDGTGNMVQQYKFEPVPGRLPSIQITVNGKQTTVRLFQQKQYFQSSGTYELATKSGNPLPKTTFDDPEVQVAYFSDFASTQLIPHLQNKYQNVPEQKDSETFTLTDPNGVVISGQVSSAKPFVLKSIYIDGNQNF